MRELEAVLEDFKPQKTRKARKNSFSFRAFRAFRGLINSIFKSAFNCTQYLPIAIRLAMRTHLKKETIPVSSEYLAEDNCNSSLDSAFEIAWLNNNFDNIRLILLSSQIE